MTESVGEFLDGLGLGKYTEAFAREDVTWDTLRTLNEADLKDTFGMSLGHRRTLLEALRTRDGAVGSQRRRRAVLSGEEEELPAETVRTKKTTATATSMAKKKKKKATTGRTVKRILVRWLPALVVAVLGSPLGVWLVQEVISDARNNITNELFVIVTALYFIVAIVLAFVLEYFWLAWLDIPSSTPSPDSLPLRVSRHTNSDDEEDEDDEEAAASKAK